jgi:hypothetical protein
MRALPGTVHINKIAAASRLLEDVCRMYDVKPEELTGKK